MANNLLSEDVLKKIISPNAKALSSPQGDKLVERNTRGGSFGVDPDPDSFNDFDDSMYLSSTLGGEDIDERTPQGYINESMATKLRTTTDYSSNDFNPDRVKKSRMLDSIKEEMVNNPIDTTALNAMMLESAGNGNAALNNSRLNKMISGAKMVEERLGDAPKSNNYQTSRVVQNQGGGAPIDYALIKTIINECLETKLNEMAERGLLSEGTTLKGIGLSKGKIKIVDNSGNIFSAKLEKIGNVKDKN